MATGRSDYPNQVNNVLCFPFLFRGALDVRARTINREMKIAVVHALAALTREPIPHEVLVAYGLKSLRSEEHTSELQSLMRNSYAVFCLKKKKIRIHYHVTTTREHIQTIESN